MEKFLIEAGLLAREVSDFGGTVIYAGVAYPCSLGSTGFSARLVAGGFSPNAETTITLRKSALPQTTAFAHGQNLTVTDRRGKVTALQIAGEGIRDLVFAWELTCADVNQSA